MAQAVEGEELIMAVVGERVDRSPALGEDGAVVKENVKTVVVIPEVLDGSVDRIHAGEVGPQRRNIGISSRALNRGVRL